ncbi:LysR family transcriptional regulator [Flavimaricola marinus]|uniref:HTH-type transcriptional regulator CynR n=1 Tax=Flavimaricola marinus TaxID=1819565 RepID=A0A238LEK1_9RHOB|nr:LysR family transcriptional regulator [Flavimaricola marinus]SMY08038.1 HTH-type transcriptional regulator CynR [Flavimaricola marinus]
MPIPRISIRALRAFIAVYEEQSFSKAAARENATQSGMSTQVKNLELKLGTPLLLRDRKEYTLTPAGQLVYRDGQAILKALMATEAAVTDMQSEVAGLVRVGLIPSLTRSVLIPALDAFKAEFAKVELSMLEEYSGSLMRRVLDGDLDFAVVPSGDIPAGLTAKFVARDREMIMGRPGALPEWPHLGPAPLSALSGARLIVPSRQNVRRKRIEGLLSAHGVHVAELMEMDGMLGTIELVGKTDWLAILPSALCYADKDGVSRKLNVLTDPPMSFDYVIVEKTESPLPNAARLLAEHLTRHTNLILEDWADLGHAAIG